jgi:hypothetical protein
MPSGACVRTATEHTSVPAVTSRNAVGGPCVTTCNGSRPATFTTVYCQVPAHSGPSRAVTVADPPTRPLAFSTAATRSIPGWPLQVTAYASLNPLDWDGVGSGGGGVLPVRADTEGDADRDPTGTGLGPPTEDGTGVHPATAAPAATLNTTTRGHLIGTC